MDRDRAGEARVDLLPERWRTAMLVGDDKQPRFMVERDGRALRVDAHARKRDRRDRRQAQDDRAHDREADPTK